MKAVLQEIMHTESRMRDWVKEVRFTDLGPTHRDEIYWQVVIDAIEQLRLPETFKIVDPYSLYTCRAVE